MQKLKKQMAELKEEDKLGRWEIENCERKRVAKIYFKTKSSKHRKQSPRALPSCQVNVWANDLPCSKVRF